jgi:hypothetical protein
VDAADERGGNLPRRVDHERLGQPLDKVVITDPVAAIINDRPGGVVVRQISTGVRERILVDDGDDLKVTARCSAAKASS